jgi:ubiquinone/menaquinone biosynthesis C-methylase UbiE
MADDVFHFLQKVFYWSKSITFPMNPVYLDIGCENGWLTAGISELIRSNEYYGIELEENYTDYIGDSKKPSKDFVRIMKPLDKFPFPDNYFDFITCINKIPVFKEREHMLHEIARVLKPGGYFMVREYNITTCISLMFVELEREIKNFKDSKKKIGYGRYLSGRALSALIAEIPQLKFIIATGRNEADRKGNRTFHPARFADFLYINEK